jgi:hypothetical protein
MEDKLRIKLEGLGLTEEQIDEIVPLFELKDPLSNEENASVIADLRARYKDECDPIQKASIAAEVISRSLDSEY